MDPFSGISITLRGNFLSRFHIFILMVLMSRKKRDLIIFLFLSLHEIKLPDEKNKAIGFFKDV